MIKIEFNKENLIKSPLNYSGNKYKLLPQILSLFPNNINTFHDLCGGSGTVLMNIKANKYIYNELNNNIKELVEYIFECDNEEELKAIDNTIIENDLGKEHKEQYYKFRDSYNENPTSRDLFILSCYCLNYMTRFNKSGKFNQSSGNRAFSDNMRESFIKTNEFATWNNIEYFNKSFTEFNDFNKDDFIYIDPPYIQTVTTYTENGLWNLDKENEMYSYLDSLDKQGVKWAMSNTIKYRGVDNDIISEWANKYNIHKLDFTYKNNNRWKKDNTLETIEVLITNY